MTNCKYKLRKLSVGLVSVGTMLIAPTVLGQEVSASTETSTTSTSTASVDATTSGTAATTPSASTSTGGTAASGASGEATVATANGGPQSAPATSEATPQPQAQTATVASASTTASPSSASDVKAPQAASTTSASSTPAAASNNSNQATGTEVETPMMEVEQYKVDKEKTELKVKDGNKLNSSGSDKQLIRNRDGKQRDIVDVTRTVKTNEDGTIDVTVTVKPKQIDEGADVMALLDVSKKMSEDDFKNAKEKIKTLVTTLTGKSSDGKENLNNRNTVRLMTFYRKISEPIDLSGKTSEEVEKELDNIWDKVKKEDWDWGVDLQGAIHRARDIFKKDQEKKSGKRQHIVLFSQGESTFSYDIHEKSKNLSRINEKITSSNPLLHWPPIFNHTHQNADMLNEINSIVKIGEQLGIKGLSNIRDILTAAGVGSGLLGSVIGGGSLTEYLTLKEYKSDKLLEESQFDYTKRVGEGYHHHSFSKRVSHNDVPFKAAIDKAIESIFPTTSADKNWFENILDKFSLVESYRETQKKALLKILEYLFHKREYHYYNHNLSAIAEAKMAQQEGITFYSVDVTDLKTTSKRVKRQVESKEDKKKEKDREDIEKKRNEKFDNYLKQMSEGGKDFFEDVDKAEKFKDILTNVTVTETFEDGVNVKDNSWQVSSENNNSLHSNYKSVTHKAASDASWWSLYSNKESLTWTISKEQLKEAFEKNSSLTFKYKLQVNKQKLLDKNKNRTKRDTSTENKTSVTKDIISNTVNYKINNQEVKGNKLDDVKLTYTKETVPVPDVEGEVVPIPEKPLVEPMTPLYPAIPNYPTPDIPTPQLPKDEDLEISGGHGPIVDIVEDTGTGVEGGAQNGVVSTQENKDPIVDITEDTQPGMSGSNDATVVEEDTAPKRPDVLVGGQSDPIDTTEDTQPGMSGSNDATVVEEDTAPKRPDILVGGQSDPIDITEDTQPGMSGSNDATVIEEDTKPKRFFHFDNEPQAPEKPKEQPSLSLPQAPVYKAAHHLPASGDKREVYFTIAALTIIGAAGLLSKKRRDTEEN
ncbi:TPA: fibronectin binding protein [Streptococcus pyogenes]|uniref:serum opacification factor n=1 Tax=Streptococcus pyogenes TaxID=1314 RepID=UPI0010A1A8E6|nr:serum opacification factor [Streptococcus pyogenes]VGV72790.1 serum opacity factor [Streptococcus pyogenes]HER5537433.1 fibronectin binding protein [Streptococcus pyogenes]